MNFLFVRIIWDHIVFKMHQYLPIRCYCVQYYSLSGRYKQYNWTQKHIILKYGSVHFKVNVISKESCKKFQILFVILIKCVAVYDLFYSICVRYKYKTVEWVLLLYKYAHSRWSDINEKSFRPDKVQYWILYCKNI